MERLNEQQIEVLKKDITCKRARVQCADVALYMQGGLVVVSKLYYNVFTDSYYETVSKCWVSLGEIQTLTHKTDRETVEKGWLCDKAYPAHVHYVREHLLMKVGQLQEEWERAGNDKVRAFLEEAIRIVKFMAKDTRF